MARYIDADALIVEHSKIEIDGLVFKHSWNEIYKNLRKAIENAPTADVVEVKHGYWYDIDSDVGWELVGCSICRREYSLCDGEDKTDYCPYCGAKMDGMNLSESPTD